MISQKKKKKRERRITLKVQTGPFYSVRFDQSRRLKKKESGGFNIPILGGL